MEVLVELLLKTSQSNFFAEDVIFSDWRFHWENNVIEAYTVLTSSGKFYDSFDQLRTPEKLGNFIDVLSLSTEQIISTRLDHKTYEAKKDSKKYLLDKLHSFSDVRSYIHSLKLVGDAGSDEWPIKIKPHWTKNMNPDELGLNSLILNVLSTTNFNIAKIKLINYWRKGLDLETLSFTDESYLSFYKILEYFEKKYSPDKTSLSEEIKRKKVKKIKKAYHMAVGAGFSKPELWLIGLLASLIDIRNQLDIAYTRINPLPKERDRSLNFSYYLYNWNLYADIKILTRFLLLNLLNMNRIALETDGGILKISKID